MDIAAWLRGLGLEQYAQLFRDNDIDGEILCGMTAEDLKELGISSFGHRRRLLNAIIALGGEPPTRDVAQSATRVTSARISPPPIDAERRQLTVMFCDLVGSTPLSARLDPEDLRSIIGAYHRCVAEIVEGFGGFVARYMGDGVLVYFGYPQAHEDDAERATRCGLALVDRVAQLGQREELHARVGIATGLVVVGGEVVEHDVAGDTPNLAARLQALAEPDTVVIAANTRRLVGDLFDYRDLGAIEVKGLAAPVPAWQVLRASAIESRFEALRGSVLTPLIGRDEEIDLLLRRWARANTGDGQVVLISGEAGISKSRLTAALAERLHAEPHIRLRCFCETQAPELIDSQPELFVQHYAEAGLVEKSVACWGKAGHRSAARSAMAEAAAQLQKGLDQLALLPDIPERWRQELEFFSALGAVLMAVKGFGAPETGHAYARARVLWERLGFPSEFLQVSYGQSLHHVARGELDLALRLDEDLLRLSRQRDDSAGLVLGHYSSGRNLMLAGRFARSRSHLEEALTLYDPITHRSFAHQAGFHPHVNSLAHLEIVLFCLGFPERALARSSAAIAEARRLAHPPSLASSLVLGARLLSLVGDDAALGERAGQLIAVATEQGFPYYRATGAIFRGWVKVKNGDVTEGISLVRSGSAACRATAAEFWMPHFIALLAAACEIAGQIEEALTLLDDTLQIVERTGERWSAAELNRHKGQLLQRQGHTEAAEELYHKALSIAGEQEAKLWELRAAVSLARLWRDRRYRAEARDLLVPVYGWFTEGFDTPDLKDAKALLDELA
jgi:class 3 adenylate cyclase/predicted ATPase